MTDLLIFIGGAASGVVSTLVTLGWGLRRHADTRPVD